MIGVFDSGFGGLTVHHALIKALPQQDFVYFGDNKKSPYGPRPPLEVLNLTCLGLEQLFQEGCTLVIIACNTASVVALRWIQQQWLPTRIRSDGIKRNVIGVVVPTIETATGMAWHETARETSPRTASHTIGVFATQRTVETDIYPLEINKRRPDIRVVQQPCPHLASAIETGASREEIRALVKKYVTQFREKLGTGTLDDVILGCTHYPLIADIFAEELPPVPIIRQPEATARALAFYLARHPEYNTGGTGKRVFLSTGFSAEALPLIERFWGEKLEFKQA